MKTGPFPFLALTAAVAVSILFPATPVHAGKIEQSVPFAVDRWFPIESTDGPVTLHRIQLERQSGGITKSTLFRPKGGEFLDTVQIRIEYTNRDRKKDWEAHLDISWLDAAGDVIDGYTDKETIDNDKSKDEIHVTLSTLKYGLRKAKTLRVRIDYNEE